MNPEELTPEELAAEVVGLFDVRVIELTATSRPAEAGCWVQIRYPGGVLLGMVRPASWWGRLLLDALEASR